MNGHKQQQQWRRCYNEIKRHQLHKVIECQDIRAVANDAQFEMAFIFIAVRQSTHTGRCDFARYGF